jgi:hypothetical protein
VTSSYIHVLTLEANSSPNADGSMVDTPFGLQATLAKG